MKIARFLLCALSLMLSTQSFALQNVTFCVWDPVGRNGPVMTFYSDVIPTAQKWGLNIRFEPYTDERVAAKEFKAGRCQAAVLTSILSRQFIKFAGTMDAVGAIDSQEGLELAIATFARERAGNLMIEGNYEVVTTFPVGSMFAFVRDRKVDTIDEFTGKKMSILNGDPQMQKWADLAGSSKVNTTLANFAGMFNSGSLDIVIMPALAYNTFELYHGLGDKGGIINYRLYYGMLQTIAKRDQFPEDFGSNMRSYMLTRMDAIHKMVSDAEEEIPAKYWINVSQSVKDDIELFSQRVRQRLALEKVNSSTALKLFWKIRCRLDRSRGECKEFNSDLNRIASEESDQVKRGETLKLASSNKSSKNSSKSVTPKPLAQAVSKLSPNETQRTLRALKEERQSLQKKLASLEAQQKQLQADQESLKAEWSLVKQEKEGIIQDKEKISLERKALEVTRTELEAQKRELSKQQVAVAQLREALLSSGKAEDQQRVADIEAKVSKQVEEIPESILEQANLIATEDGLVSAEPSAAGNQSDNTEGKPKWWQYIFFWTL